MGRDIFLVFNLHYTKIQEKDLLYNTLSTFKNEIAQCKWLPLMRLSVFLGTPLMPTQASIWLFGEHFSVKEIKLIEKRKNN